MEDTVKASTSGRLSSSTPFFARRFAGRGEKAGLDILLDLGKKQRQKKASSRRFDHCWGFTPCSALWTDGARFRAANVGVRSVGHLLIGNDGSWTRGDRAFDSRTKAYHRMFECLFTSIKCSI